MDLSIIIVNWNSKDHLRKCVQSLYAHATDMPFEIIVVDGASYDGCGEMLAREFPSVKFIQSQKNAGFASANNLGAASSSGLALLFLNPDTEVVGNALDRLLGTLNRFPDTGLVGARLLNSDRSLQTSCVQSFPTVLNQVLDAEWLRRIFPRSLLWGMGALFDGTQNPFPVEVVSGACIMIKRSVFQGISGFDERYFMYSEDLDLCWRVQRAGYDCLYVPDAQIVHHGGGSSGAARSMFSTVMTRESVFRFLKYHRGSLVAFGYRMALGCAALIRLPLIVGRMAFQKMTGESSDSKSFRKWIAILRWSAGLESWAKRQTGGGESVPPAEGISKNCSAAPVGTGN